MSGDDGGGYGSSYGGRGKRSLIESHFFHPSTFADSSAWSKFSLLSMCVQEVAMAGVVMVEVVTEGKEVEMVVEEAVVEDKEKEIGLAQPQG